MIPFSDFYNKWNGKYCEVVIKSPKYGEKTILIDKDDLEKLKGAYIHNNDGDFYIRVNPSKKSLHRIILGDKKGFVIDHINGNTLDNRKTNLRYLTRQENVFNRHKSSKGMTGIVGVYPCLNKFQVKIKVNYKSIYLGVYKTLEEAKEARKQAEIKYWGYTLTI